MKQNNCRTKLKTIIAVMLVMASLFAMSSMVNAGIVELILGKECADVASVTSSSIPPPPSSITSWSSHALDRMAERDMGQDYLEFIFSDATPTWNSQHQSWNYTDGEATICVNSSGVVTTVYWNNEY